MQALRNATAVFCVACICAQVLACLAGSGPPRRCIKAAAGLYILAVLVHALPQIGAQVAAFSLPQAQPQSFGTVEQTVLQAAEQQLEQTLAAQCLEQTGVQVSLRITLEQSGQDVRAAAAEAVLPAGTTEPERESAAAFLRQALGTEPVLASGEDGA